MNLVFTEASPGKNTIGLWDPLDHFIFKIKNYEGYTSINKVRNDKEGKMGIWGFKFFTVFSLGNCYMLSGSFIFDYF